MGREAPLSALRELRDSYDDSGFSRALWTKLVTLGWSGMTLPEAYGGSDFGIQGLGVVFEEAGRTLAATPLLATVVLGVGLVNRLGTEAQRTKWLPEVVAGTRLLALAIAEQPRHQP